MTDIPDMNEQDSLYEKVEKYIEYNLNREFDKNLDHETHMDVKASIDTIDLATELAFDIVDLVEDHYEEKK